MSERSYRIEQDSLGEVRVPRRALYGAQTQRAAENFPISGLRMPRAFIRALGLIKACAARSNGELHHLESDIAQAVVSAAEAVARGEHDDQFPVDVFQTGSGTSSNMNANEVIARLAADASGRLVHPNDHVNCGQSSNDVIPTAIHASALLEVREQLLPALMHLAAVIDERAAQLADVVKTGRTHLMDALPLTLGQELGAWASQVRQAMARIEGVQPRLAMLAQGGTAVGTGLTAHEDFAARFAHHLSLHTGITFVPASDPFAAIACQDTAVELSGQLKTAAVALMKIANDLRWMNSGPLTGLAEIRLPVLQPGSSIMAGKVNPVIPEAVAMACTQVMGNDVAVGIAGQSGNFQLNTMLPLIAYNLLQSIQLLANSARLLADKAVSGFEVNRDKLAETLHRNPLLVTALNRLIGYDQAAAIAKQAYAEGRAILDVAVEVTGLPEEELRGLLDPRGLVGSTDL